MSLLCKPARVLGWLLSRDLGVVTSRALGLLLAWLAAMSVQGVHGRRCRFSLEAEGWLPAGSPAKVLHGVTSQMTCVEACTACVGSRYLSFGYSQGQGECRLYSFLTSSGRVASPGYRYYTGCPALMGESCSTFGDCQKPELMCLNGSCQCGLGYHFHPGSSACLASCPDGYGTRYTTIKGYYQYGYFRCFYPGSFQACHDECVKNASCVSFDWELGPPRGCCLYNITWLATPWTGTKLGHWAHHELYCA